MAQQPHPPVKIYDCPKTKGLSPVLIAVPAVVLLAIAFVAYRALAHPDAVPPQGESIVGGLASPTESLSMVNRRFVLEIKRVGRNMSSKWASTLG